MVLIHRHLGPLPPPAALLMGRGGAYRAGGGALRKGRRLWRRNLELSGKLSQEKLAGGGGGGSPEGRVRGAGPTQSGEGLEDGCVDLSCNLCVDRPTARPSCSCY